MDGWSPLSDTPSANVGKEGDKKLNDTLYHIHGIGCLDLVRKTYDSKTHFFLQ